jgi:ribose transport system permease protein
VTQGEGRGSTAPAPEDEPRAPLTAAVAENLSAWFEGVGRFAAILILVIGLFIYFSVTEPRFFEGQNLENLLSGVSILWVVSMGMTFVVLTAGIDLSVGSMLALMGVVLANMLNAGVPDWLGVILVVLCGAILGGALNGVLIGYVGLSFFVVTLGSMAILHGAVALWTGVETIYINSSLIESIGIGHVGGIPVPIWIMLGTFVVGFAVLRFAYFGRDVYAVGGNQKAARLSGVNVSRTLMAVYAISGGCAALGTVIQAGRLGAASPLVGTEIPLQAAAAVLLGGTSFVGGVGSVVGTAVGVLFIGTLQNGLGIAGVSAFWQEVITGTILILAVLIDRVRQDSSRFRLRRETLRPRRTAE